MSWWDSTHTARLDPAALGLHGRELEIAQIIAKETEAQREIERSQLPPATPDELAAIVSGPGLLSSIQETEGKRRQRQIDFENWADLLLKGSAHVRCARRAGLDLASVIEFAIDKCNAPNWQALFWYRQWVMEALSDKLPADAVLAMLAKKEQESAAARAAYERSREGASAGGKKSAAVRRANAKIPSAATLKAEKQRLLATGTAPHNVAGKLANMYGVSGVAIRAKLAEAEKEK